MFKDKNFTHFIKNLRAVTILTFVQFSNAQRQLNHYYLLPIFGFVCIVGYKTPYERKSDLSPRKQIFSPERNFSFTKISINQNILSREIKFYEHASEIGSVLLIAGNPTIYLFLYIVVPNK